MKGLPRKVKEADFNAFIATVKHDMASVGKAITALTQVVQTLLPPQEDTNGEKTIIEDARSGKDKDYEKALSLLMADVAKNGPKLVTVSGRYGTETHNMSEIAAKTIMDIQREKKQYKTVL